MNPCIVLILVSSILGISKGQYDPHFAPGRTTIVHLFEWKWEDISLECERFLGMAGFGGVQVQNIKYIGEKSM
jgi:alpha-amylase